MNARSTPSSANPSFSSTRRIGAFRRSVVACTRGYPFSSSHSANSRTASLPTRFPRSPSKRTIPISQTPGGAKRASPRAWIVPTRRPSLSIARLSRPPDHSPECSSACFCASTPLETTLPVVPARASIPRSSSSGRTGRSTTRSLSSRSTGLIVGPLAGRPNTGSTRPRRPLSIVGVVIEVRGLTKDYGDKRAVDGLTFTVQPGAVTGFLGPNGSGKSTTMRLILGLDRPNAGTATVNGKPYRDHTAPLHEVGALLEARSVHTGRSAYNHLRALAETHGIPRSRVDELVDLVGLHEVARKRAGTFSLGMGHRLGIASALLGDPHTLLLDEPANGLDPEGIHWMRNLLTSLAAEGRAVFVSSHLMSEMSLTPERRHDGGRLHPQRVETSRAREVATGASAARPGGARRGDRDERGTGAHADRGDDGSRGRRRRRDAPDRAARADACTGVARGGVHGAHARRGRVQGTVGGPARVERTGACGRMTAATHVAIPRLGV